MKRNMITAAYIVLIASILVTSCSSSELPSPISIDNEYLNHQIFVRAPSDSNTFNTQDVIYLEIKYNSTNKIVFPNNYNLRIFENTLKKWIEIKEKPMTRIPAGDIILSPEKMLPAVQGVYVSPALPDPGKKYSLRIYVIGQMEANGQSISVAAYTDVILRPK